MNAPIPSQGRAIGTATKSVSKVQKQATKERLRQKRKRIAAAAAAAADGTEDAETVKERNLRYFVATAKADAEVKKLMREVFLLPISSVNNAELLPAEQWRTATLALVCNLLLRPQSLPFGLNDLLIRAQELIITHSAVLASSSVRSS